jgi:hypothetical protein
MSLPLVLMIAAAVLLAAPFVLGAALPATRAGQAECLLPAPPEAVRALILDVRRQPDWRAGIASVTVEVDARGWTETTRAGEVVRFRLLETAPAIRLSFASSRGYHGQWTGLLTPEGDGTRLSVTEEATVPGYLNRLLARLFFDPEAYAARYLAELEAALRR